MKVVNRHIPRPGFNALKRTQVDVDNFCELFLGELAAMSHTEDVPPDNDVWFDCSLHPALHAVNTMF